MNETRTETKCYLFFHDIRPWLNAREFIEVMLGGLEMCRAKIPDPAYTLREHTLSVITSASIGRRRQNGAMDSSISTYSSSLHRQWQGWPIVYILVVINLLVGRASCRPPGPETGSSGDPAFLPHGAPQGVSKPQHPDIPGKNAISQPHKAHDGGTATSLTDRYGPIPNHIPKDPNHFPGTYADIPVVLATGPGKQKARPVPKYMVDLYNKYTTDKYIHPVTNIVRGYMNINEDTLDETPSFGNRTRVHVLVFNITSISPDEDVYLSELRLYKLVQADRNQFNGVNRHVSVHELIYGDDLGNRTLFVASKDLYGPDSGWETFTVTEAVRRWVRAGLPWELQILEIRIDSFDNDGDNADVDIDTRPRNENEPLLVVFSNDNKAKRTEAIELHEMITQQTGGYVMFEEDQMENEIDEDYEYDYDIDYPYAYGHDFAPEYTRRKRDVTNNMQRLNQSQNSEHLRSKDRLEHLYRKILKINNATVSDTMERKTTDKVNLTKRSNKSRGKRRRGRRKFCRRRPLYVDFQAINWHTWIIAPGGYQAFQCVGWCDYPLSDHLTPTKHAIVQTLVHANYASVRRRHKTEPACCVPTRLEPISILYTDDKGIVTYKYDYDDMVVAECGCR